MISFIKPLSKIILQRTSRRTYNSIQVSETKKQILENLFPELQNLVPFGTKMRFQLLSFPNISSTEKKKLGTYGIITGAHEYIVGAVNNSANNWIDYGYALELLILKAADLDLGTCWLGGYFSRSAFAELIDLQPNESLPAITPIGEMEERNSKEKLVRFVVRAKKRKPWGKIFFLDNLKSPLTKDSDPKILVNAFEWVRLAPSAGNKQPWRLLYNSEDQRVDFFLDRSKRKKGGLYWRLNYLDIGIAMVHFEIAHTAENISGKWKNCESEIKYDLNDTFEYVISWVYAKK
jgi:hypothetical protein